MAGNESGNEDLPSHKDESGFVKTFPQRLFELLESVEDDPENHSITWSPTGDAFMIVDQAAFVDKLLPRFFKRTKFTSFKGKLYRWGFRRVGKGSNAGAYFHKLFLKDNPTLCLHMRRQMKGKNDAANDIIIPEEAIAATPIASTTITSEQKKTVKKPKTKLKAKNKDKPSSLPMTTKSLDGNKGGLSESNAFPPSPYPSVGQLSDLGMSNNVMPKPNITNSSFMSSKESSQALLGAQAFANMLRGSPQDITRALVEEGEEIEGDEVYSSYIGSHNTDVTQIANRLSNSNINEVIQDDSLDSFPRPSTGLLNLHKNMYKGLMNMPSMNSISPTNTMSQWNPYGQRKKYQQNTKQSLQDNRFFSKNRKNLSFSLPQQHYQDQDMQEGSLAEWRIDDNEDSSDKSKLDMLSNAALSFRTPFLQEYRTMDEPMQDSDEDPLVVVNRKLELGRSIPRPDSTYTFKGQMV